MNKTKPTANVDETTSVPRLRVAPVIVKDDAILLVRHIKGGKTYWLLPGGGVEYGESLAEALIREVKEEANLDILIGHLILVNDSIPPDRHRHVVNLYFTAEVTGGQLVMGSDDNLAELRYVPLDELTELEFYPDVRHELLQAIRAGYPDRAAYLGNLWK